MYIPGLNEFQVNHGRNRSPFSCWLCGHLEIEENVKMGLILVRRTAVERDDSYPSRDRVRYFRIHERIGMGEFHQIAQE